MEKGKNYGVMNAGYYALRALRIEKMLAFWGQDLDKNTTPYGLKSSIALTPTVRPSVFYLSVCMLIRVWPRLSGQAGQEGLYRQDGVASAQERTNEATIRASGPR